MKKIIFIGILIMIVFLIGCSRPTCREGWIKTDYIGISNSVEEAKDYFVQYMAKGKYNVSEIKEKLNITMIEGNLTTMGGELIYGYWINHVGSMMLGKDGYKYTFGWCG